MSESDAPSLLFYIIIAFVLLGVFIAFIIIKGGVSTPFATAGGWVDWLGSLIGRLVGVK